jgi:hypothetical protein
MNVNKVLTMNYEKKDTWWTGKKRTQTNPNKPNFRKAKMNETLFAAKDYENQPHCGSKSIQSQPVVSLPVLSVVEASNQSKGSNPPVVSLHPLSEAEGSNLFQNCPNPQKGQEQENRPACLRLNQMKPKFSHFCCKNSLTVRCNSLKYLLSYGK